MDVAIFNDIEEQVSTLDDTECLIVNFVFRENWIPPKGIRLSNDNKINKISYSPETGIIELRYKTSTIFNTEYFRERDILYIDIVRH